MMIFYVFGAYYVYNGEPEAFHKQFNNDSIFKEIEEMRERQQKMNKKIDSNFQGITESSPLKDLKNKKRTHAD